MEYPKIIIKLTKEQHFRFNLALVANPNCWRVTGAGCTRDENGRIDCQKCVDTHIQFIFTDEQEGGEEENGKS